MAGSVSYAGTSSVLSVEQTSRRSLLNQMNVFIHQLSESMIWAVKNQLGHS